MRKWSAVGTVGALVVAIPAIVWAFDPTGSSEINRQFFKFRTGTVTNTSTTFHTVPGFESLATRSGGTTTAKAGDLLLQYPAGSGCPV
jgi:hypothetical protein